MYFPKYLERKSNSHKDSLCYRARFDKNYACLIAQIYPGILPLRGIPGFVRVVDSKTLAFPDYDGNGMFKSQGNILVVRVQAEQIFPNCPRYIHITLADSRGTRKTCPAVDWVSRTP